METITDKGGYVKAIMADGITILEGVGKTCSKCKAIQPVVDELIQKYPDAHFSQYDVEEVHDVAQELRVNEMPTFHIFKDGELEDKVTGAVPDALRKAVADAVGKQ